MKFAILFIALVFLFSCGKSPEPTPGPTPEPVPNPIDPSEPQVMIGSAPVTGQTYSWSPIDGLNDPKSSQPIAAPKKTTLYTVSVTSKCGVAKSSVVVHVFKKGPTGELVEVK